MASFSKGSLFLHNTISWSVFFSITEWLRNKTGNHISISWTILFWNFHRPRNSRHADSKFLLVVIFILSCLPHILLGITASFRFRETNQTWGNNDCLSELQTLWVKLQHLIRINCKQNIVKITNAIFCHKRREFKSIKTVFQSQLWRY